MKAEVEQQPGLPHKNWSTSRFTTAAAALKAPVWSLPLRLSLEARATLPLVTMLSRLMPASPYCGWACRIPHGAPPAVSAQAVELPPGGAGMAPSGGLPRLPRLLLAVAALSTLPGGLRECRCDHYVVRLALDGRLQAEGSQAPETVNMSIGGYPFQCALPTASDRGRQRAAGLSRYVAAARAAAFSGRCFRGAAEGGAGDVELCVGDRLALGGASGGHEAESDQAERGGGFTQLYAGFAGGGRPLRARVLCTCDVPGAMSPESPCRMGDVVFAPHGENRRLAAGVVAEDGGGESMLVAWPSRPEERIATVRRADAVTEGGRRCVPPPDPPPLARITHASPDVGVEIAAVTCCDARSLRSVAGGEEETEVADLEFWRLLSPLTGRCMRVMSVWHTYELCWPWRVRQLHLTTSGTSETPSITLGHFQGLPGEDRPVLVKQRTRSRRGGHELAMKLQGDKCAHTVHTWSVALPGVSGATLTHAVGGTFNPTGLDEAEGTLIHVKANAAGCEDFAERLDGAVVLVRRGSCWFHTKALRAQAAGARAIVVLNDGRPMVDTMEGVDELASPTIPTVLVDREQGIQLLRSVGARAVVEKFSADGMDLSKPVTTTVVFRCREDWHDKGEACQAGDFVEVRLVDAEDGATQWPHSAVRVLKATIAEIHRHNGSLSVAWEPVGDGADGELPSTVPLNATFRDGVPCSSEAGAYIQRLTEPHACQVEVDVHVAALCAHPQLLPRPPREAQEITCVADEATRRALANGPELEQYEEADLPDPPTVAAEMPMPDQPPP